MSVKILIFYLSLTDKYEMVGPITNEIKCIALVSIKYLWKTFLANIYLH